MNQVQANRLAHAIEFLQEMKPEGFDFNTIRRDTVGGRKCGTVGCVIGWTPEMFPNLVRRTTGKERFWNSHLITLRNNKIHGADEFHMITAYLFGLGSDVFYPGRTVLMPNGKKITTCTGTASNYEVANMLIRVLDAHGYDYV